MKLNKDVKVSSLADQEHDAAVNKNRDRRRKGSGWELALHRVPPFLSS